ncbi:MAG: GAF domain-containing protein [Anaerolineae bacterium]
MTENRVQRVPPTRLTIRGRLIWGFVAVLLLLLAGVVTNAWALAQLEWASTALQEEADRATAALQVARAAANLLAALGQASSAQDQDHLMEVVSQARADLGDAQRVLSETMVDLPERDAMQMEASRAQRRVARVDSLADLIVPQIQAGNWESVHFYQDQLLADYHRIMAEPVENIISLTEERQAAAIADATAARQLTYFILGGFAVLALIAAVVTAVTTIRNITGPVQRLMEGATHLAAGHLEERVPVERGDELGGLATVFNEMAERLQTLYAELEQRVAERTEALQKANYALQRRAIQLETSAEVGRAIVSIFDVDQLLRTTVDLIRDRFGFYHAGIFLLDEAGEWAVLQEATGEAGAQMKAQGHRLAVGDTSMVGWTAAHRQPRIALYAEEDAVRFANPLLPYTRSEMTLPLMVGGWMIGVLNVQSTEEAAFDDDDVRALQGMADQVAIAIENARRVSDRAALLETISPIYRASRRLTAATATGDVADAIIGSVAETGADGCIVVEFEFSPAGEPEALLYLGVWRRDREPQFQPGLRLPVVESPFPFEMVSTLWVVTDVAQDERLPQSARQVFQQTGARALVNIPLRAREKVIGQVVVLRATSGPFSDAALRLYEVLSDQAAVALERAQLLERAQRSAEREQLARQMVDRIRRAVDVEQALQATAEELSRAMGVPHVSIELEAPMHE